jgi:hypothetical protein
MRLLVAPLVLACLAFIVPATAFAHEVYVLDPAQIAYGLATPPFSEMDVVWGDFSQFLFWAFVSALAVFVVFFVSILRPIEERLDPFFVRMRRFAAPVARITLALAFLAAAYYGALGGPELPLAGTFGAFAPLVRLALAGIGIALLVRVYVEIAALAALAIFGASLAVHGAYMLTYANYLGEIILFIILGAHHGARVRTGREVARSRRHQLGLSRYMEPVAKRLAPYSFAILRVAFGISLLYASVYAKILHNQLALLVADLPLGHAHSLAYVFGFEPHFLVLGAALIEIVIASFYILGIEIRFVSLFLLFWLSLSLVYFGESVWPHIILIGIPIAFILYGYDRYGLEGAVMKRRGWEPVL